MLDENCFDIAYKCNRWDYFALTVLKIDHFSIVFQLGLNSSKCICAKSTAAIFMMEGNVYHAIFLLIKYYLLDLHFVPYFYSQNNLPRGFPTKGLNVYSELGRNVFLICINGMDKQFSSKRSCKFYKTNYCKMFHQ